MGVSADDEPSAPPESEQKEEPADEEALAETEKRSGLQLFLNIIDLPESFFKDNAYALEVSGELTGHTRTGEYDGDEDLPEFSHASVLYSQRLFFDCKFEPKPRIPEVPVGFWDWYHRSSGLSLGAAAKGGGSYFFEELEDTYEQEYFEYGGGFEIQVQGKWFFSDRVGVGFKLNKERSISGENKYSNSFNLENGLVDENEFDEDEDFQYEEEWEFETSYHATEQAFQIEWFILKDLKLFAEFYDLEGSGDFDLKDYEGVGNIPFNIDGSGSRIGVQALLFRHWKVGIEYYEGNKDTICASDFFTSKIDTEEIQLTNTVFITPYLGFLLNIKMIENTEEGMGSKMERDGYGIKFGPIFHTEKPEYERRIEFGADNLTGDGRKELVDGKFDDSRINFSIAAVQTWWF